MMVATPDTVTRYVGNCQLCEGDFKLTDASQMVHHGYKRPGHGNIEGDCPGVFRLPYELSCEDIKRYVKGLKQIDAGKVVYFEEVETNWRSRLLVTSSFSKYVSAHFEAHLNDRRRKLEYTEYSLMRDIKHRTARIKAWVKKPIRTIEEIAAKEQADKDARKAEREAARAARNAKKAATTAKQAALRARRQAEMDAFDAKIIAAAAMPKDQHWVAKHELRAERNLKKNSWMWEFHHSADAQQALLSLGMGHYGHNKVVYGDWH